MSLDLPENVGFIGLGLMGMPMVQNLAGKLPETSRIFVYDVVEEAVAEICSLYEERRVCRCKNAKDVAKRADTVLTMVPEGSHVEAVYLTPETGVLATDLSNKLLIDCSTIDTATSSKVASALNTHYPNASFYDAPVSGGVLGAEKGSMTFMLGCAAGDPLFPKIEALLSLMGGNIFACGGPTLGLTAKLCNNYCSGLIAIATSEAFNIGIKKGMDPRVLANVFGKSLAQSCINDKWNPCPGICPDAPASKGYQGGFKVGLMRKDFNLACELGKEVGADLSLAKKGLEVYTGAMNDENCQGLDSRVVYRYLGGDEHWKKRFPDT